MIDLKAVHVLNSRINPFDLPVIARFDRIGLQPNAMTIASTGTDSWGHVDIEGKANADDDQRATLWVLLPFGGAWYAAGAERLRPAQLNGVKPVAEPRYGGLETLIGDGWFGSHDAPLRGARLTTGQLVGFCLVPGSTRKDNRVTVQGRSDVIICQWPDANGANPLTEVWREGAAAPVVPPVKPAPEATELEQLRNALAGMGTRVTQLETTVAALVATQGRVDPSLLENIGLLASRVDVLEQQAASIKIPTSAVISLLGRRFTVPLQ